jgi:hypothetical protein
MDRFMSSQTKAHRAVKVLGDIPALCDRIYADFPQAYNDAGGSFGRISVTT